MSDNFYSVLKTESIQKLKKSVETKPSLLELSFDDLCDDLHLSLVTTNYKINSDIALVMPKGVTQELNGDAENCKLILQILPELTPAQATDERLWATLCFSEFKDYANERWPFRSAEESKLHTHISTHWFANGVRGRMRDNAISRLWWMGYMAKNIPEFSLEKVFEILFFNSDYRSSLLERNSTANAINVTTAILKITDEAYASGVPFKRDSFRNFMGKVDTLGGRSNLASMDVASLVKVLKPIYTDAYATKAE